MTFNKVTKLYNIHHIPVLNNSTVPKIYLMPIYSSPQAHAQLQANT